MTTETDTKVHPRNQNYKWPRHVKLAAYHLYLEGGRVCGRARALAILEVLTEWFPVEMAPVLSKADGGVGSLQNRLGHMYTKNYENEHPDNWDDIAVHQEFLRNLGWPQSDLNKTCGRCGDAIPDSEHRRESDVGMYWCDSCEEHTDR